jgi:alpha-glucosidase
MKMIPSVLFALVLFTTAAHAAERLLESPDKAVRAAIDLSPEGALTYRVDFKGKPVISASRLGFTTEDKADLTAGYSFVSEARTAVNQTWKPPFGERSLVADAYQSLTLAHKIKGAGDLTLTLECRAYNAGFAFRYVFPKQTRTQLDIAKENTEFAFTGNHRAWPVYSAQGTYKPALLSEVKDGAERPLTVELTDGPVVAIGEAGLFTFARMKFAPLAGKPNTLVSKLDGRAVLPLPGATPWRYVMVADSAARLLEQNDFILNLNEPSKIADTSWIKPGKVIRETSLTTTGGKACVDFAKVMNLQYVEFDAGWYGHEYDDASDARTVTLDPKRSKGPLDLQEVIRYGKEKGVGVLLYVNRRELERRLDELLPLYKSWGVAGLKYGFVNVGNQKWTAWLHEAIRKAGEAGLMLDIHDEYRLTGNQRTWPNVMTVEGISGNEEMPEAAHNCALPFTRYLCGPGDYTPCWYNNRVKNTRAHQLALPAVYYSPWQFLFWYDNPSLYKADPELDFWRQIPTVWDDTKVLNAKIGAYATVARRSGDAWFVGSINALERRTLALPLTFLTPGKTYTAQIYSDAAPDGSDRTKVACATREVTAADTLSADMAANGGHAVRLVPVN